MPRATPGIGTTEIARWCRRKGCELQRTGRHEVWRTPNGELFTLPVSRSGKAMPTFKQVKIIANALGVDTNEVGR